MLKTGAVQRCVADILAKAKEFREAFSAEPQARSLEWAALQVERALRDESEQLLSLAQAAELSGYHPDSLARMVRDGQIPDLRPPNSKGMIRIRRGDLPIKAGLGPLFFGPEPRSGSEPPARRSPARKEGTASPAPPAALRVPVSALLCVRAEVR